MIVFDLDGVLIDPSEALSRAWTSVGAEFGLSIREEQYRKWVGIPLSDVLQQIEAAPSVRLEIGGFFESVMTSLVDSVVPYPGVLEGLESLRSYGYELAVFTSKPRTRAIHSCARLGLGDVIVVAPQDLPPFKGKPSPDGLVLISGIAGISPERISFLGDSPSDLESARSAGSTFYHAAWGFHAVPQDTAGFDSFDSFGEFVDFAIAKDL